ncbi:MAG: hypothetical protein OXP66_12395 [Candidatus Tectomicrobia bacterium]|nr:hypothetical protein [Candidatus Tectomicrobia bacterium]
MRTALWLVGAVLALGVCSAVSQERNLPSPFFDCPFINYFDSGCPELEREAAQAAPQELPEAERSAAEVEGEHGNEWVEENPELLAPLFPRESLGRDAPELYRLLLINPTLDNARRFVRWYSRRMERIAEAQKLIAMAGGEFLAGGAVE